MTRDEALTALQRVREKYPQYTSLDDGTLASRLAAKYPQYQSLADAVSTPDFATSPEQAVTRTLQAKFPGTTAGTLTPEERQQIQQGSFTPAPEVARGTAGLDIAPATRATAARVAAGAAKNGPIRRTMIVDTRGNPEIQAINQQIEQAQQGYQQSQIAAAQQQAAMQEASRARAPGQDIPVIGGLSSGISGLGHDIMSLSARAVAAVTPSAKAKTFFDQVADEANRYGQEVASRDSALNRPIAGATRSLGTTVLGAATGGIPGMVTAAMATQGNQAITEGRQAGLTGWDLASYAATQGALEGAVTAAFQGLGLGGVEKTLAKDVATRAFGTFLKTLGRTTAEELPDELLTQVAQNVHKYLTGVDATALDSATLTRNLTDVALQTLLTSGFASGLQTLQAPAPAQPTGPPAPPQPTQITNPTRLLMTPEQSAALRAEGDTAAAVAARQRAEAALAGSPGEVGTFAVDEQGRAATPEQWAAREQAGQDLAAKLAAPGPKLLAPGARFLAGEQGVIDREAMPTGDRRVNLEGRAAVEQALAAGEDPATLIEKYKKEARTDPITGLGNALAAQEALDAAQQRATKTNAAQPIIYLDMANLKAANDTPGIGHEAVDKWWRETLAPQLQALAPGAVISRKGGDEFVIVFPARTSARKARAVLAELNQMQGLPIAENLSMFPAAGVGLLKPGGTVSQAITEAETAMSAQKGAAKRARGEETDSMKVRASLPAKGEEVAAKLGLTFNGPQANVAGKPSLNVFTDPQTGSTFMLPQTASEAQVTARLTRLRQTAQTAQPTRAAQARKAFQGPPSVIPPTAGRVKVRTVATTAVPSQAPAPAPKSRVGRFMHAAAEALPNVTDRVGEWLAPDGVYKRPAEWVKGKQRLAAEDTIARERGVRWAVRFEHAAKQAKIDLTNPQTSLALHQTLSGEKPMTDWAPEIQDLLGEWRHKQDAASTAYADALEAAGLTERAEVVRQNTGAYTKSVPAWTIEARGRIAQALKSFKSSLQHTTSLRKFRRDAWTVYDRRGRVQAKFPTEAEAKTYRAAQDDAAALKIAAPRTAAERAAEDVHDLRFLLLAGVGEAVHDTQILQLHSDVARTMAVAPPKGLPDAEHAAWAKENDLEKLPGYGRYHKLQNKYVPTKVAEDLTELVNMPTGLQALLNSYMKVWKKGVLVYNPATHGRNLISNTFFFSTLARTSPANPANWKHYGQAFRDIVSKGAAWEKAVRAGVIGGDYHSAVIADLKRFAANPGNQSPGAIWAKMRQIDQTAGRLYSMEDDLFKAAAFLKYQSQGMSEQAAAAEVQKWFPQHDRTSKLAKLMAKKWYGMPFASFFDQTIRIMGRGAKERPIATATMMAMPGLLNFVSGVVAGVTDDEDEILRASQGFMEKYFTPYLPWRDSKGRPLTLDLRYIYPLANDLLPDISNHGALRIPWLMNGPIPTTIVEQLSGRRLFTGKEFKGTGDRLAAAASNLAPLPSVVKTAPFRVAKALSDSPTAEDAAYAIVGSVAGINARQPYAAERDVVKAAAAAWADDNSVLVREILATWNQKYRPDYLRPITMTRVQSQVERDKGTEPK